ncbi:MAG TPA: protein translocase subunit SecD [Firmicutes bacterium]|nr:protein translocase subunit SecD [Bacillota bacterium]HHY97120.1 protein translocase subunit SecD [Bacillota bacterium]
MNRTNLWKLIGILVLTVFCAVTIYYRPLNLGLDLRGGTRLVLEAQDTDAVKVDEDAVMRAKEVIERRIDQMGLAEPVIYRQGDRRVVVELAGVRDPDRAKKIIGQTAQLEFKDESGRVVMTGADLRNATAGPDEYGRPSVHFELTPEGAKKFEIATRENLGRRIAILLDNQMLSNPQVQAVIKDKGIIQGIESMNTAKDLAMMLRAGALPVPMKLLHSEVLEPMLGKESIQQSAVAAVVGVGLVLLYMLGIYKLPGLMADIALLIYGVLVMASLAGLHATLTLPGIAGLILSVGMAVDANVIIFERIKEEIRGGKRLGAAIRAGHDRALNCILDSNITTLITGAVLYLYGTGSVKGFAVTLGLGVLISMFTAVVVTRTIMSAIVDRNPDKYVAYFGA